MNFLDLLNIVARAARPAHFNLTPITDMETPFTETEIDSLDGMMVVMYMSLIYDIHDDLCKDFHPETPQQLFDFIQEHKKREAGTLAEIMEIIK